MSHISPEDVERVARLARIRLDEAERTAMARDLEAVLVHVETLAEVETADVAPTSHVLPLPTPLREDEPEGSLDPEVALANAPSRSGTAFAVPRVLDTEEEG
jgi:aspartyl-tRNA(Asn)/glutamyl-tRNA(Gln) amidotransferase subunit C